MFADISYKIFFVFCFNLIIKCEETTPPPNEDTTLPPIEDYPVYSDPRLTDRISTSSYVSEEGNFHFLVKGLESNINIEVYGYLINTNGTKTLELTGDYKFGNTSLRFTANDQLGFFVKIPDIPQYAPVPSRVIASILGK